MLQIPYPGYLLNPGDMFQVEPDRVLFATGAPKQRDQARNTRVERKKRRQANIALNAAEQKAGERRAARAEKALADESAAISTQSNLSPAALGDPEVRKLRRQHLLKIVEGIESRMSSKTIRTTGKRKQELREILRKTKRTLVQINRKPVQELDTEIKEITQLLSGMTEADKSSEKAILKKPKAEVDMSPKMKGLLEAAIARIRDNPVDDSKPYATPWQPRPYMSAFAFIPRYLEVNHNICSAVYLRHPVARPGFSEVPSPLPVETHQLAFNWYLRRR